MSQEEQDQTVGRNLRERKELAHTIAMLRAKAAKHGTELRTLGQALENSPESVVFAGASNGASSIANFFRADVANYPQVDEIIKLGNEIRQTMDALQRKEEEASRLGI